jgi:type I restriction enzyme, R subunit
MSYGTFNEASTVQHGLIARLTQPDLGWRYVRGADLHRSTDSPFIEDELVAALLRLNPSLQEDTTRVESVIPRLRATTLEAVNDGLITANERMMVWMRGVQVVRFIGQSQLVPIEVIAAGDNNRSLNSYLISDEVSFGVAGRLYRFDLVLWINGLPVCVIETKSPVNSNVSWLNAARDIAAYQESCAPFFVSNILSLACDGLELHYGAIGQRPEHWVSWHSTKDEMSDPGWLGVLRSVELLASPERLISILRDYTLFERAPGTRTKLIPRYAQVEGVEAIHERVLAPGRRQGLIWHYQGTGKTLLMGFAALRLLNDDRTEGATVLIVLDRIDLIEQTVRQFQTVGLPRCRVASSREDLRQILLEDHRGIVITTIFKFADSPALNHRENIIVLIDEAHRTQDGALGRDLRRALPNAQFFGLTGTPIIDTDRNTYRLFGDPSDPGWVLNEYSMSRAISDGTSVPIQLETRLIDYNIDARSLDEAFAAMSDEERLDDEERESLSQRVGATKTLMGNPTRVAAVCSDIVEHYLTKVAPLGLKAQVVAYDRDLCVRYHEAITAELRHRGAPQEIAVVMTVGTSKDEPAEWKERFSLNPASEARVKLRFNRADDPLSILIVTSKLLTGFDAPIEGAMYLDKPLRRHTLFQAICRTNRRFTNPETGQEKQFGLIVDYVGLGAELVRGLRLADPDGSVTRLPLISDLIAELSSMISSALTRFTGIDRGESSMEALFEAQDRIPPGVARNEFGADFVAIQNIWELIWPDQALDALRADYRWLAIIYESIKPRASSNVLLWHRLGAKTLDLVYESISDIRVEQAGAGQVIVDTETLGVIRRLRSEETDESDDQKLVTVEEALNTIEARLRLRLVSSRRHPIYVALSERLQRLQAEQLGRVQTSVEFLRELLEVARELLATEHIEDSVGLGGISLLPDPKLGALTQILNEYAPSQPSELVQSAVADIDHIVRQVGFAGWSTSQPGDRAVRLEIRRVLRRHQLPTTGDLFDKTYSYVRENY